MEDATRWQKVDEVDGENEEDEDRPLRGLRWWWEGFQVESRKRTTVFPSRKECHRCSSERRIQPDLGEDDDDLEFEYYCFLRPRRNHPVLRSPPSPDRRRRVPNSSFLLLRCLLFEPREPVLGSLAAPA